MWLLPIANAIAACAGPVATFDCTSADQCDDGEHTGLCEPSGYCSFPDVACDSGRRYDPSASPDLSGTCVPAVPLDCLDAFQHGITANGVVTIDPDGANSGNPPFDMYCDMTTAGGGWTLVWVYTFTDYGNFTTAERRHAAADLGDPVRRRHDADLDHGAVSPMTTGALEFTRWPASVGTCSSPRTSTTGSSVSRGPARS